MEYCYRCTNPDCDCDFSLVRPSAERNAPVACPEGACAAKRNIVAERTSLSTSKGWPLISEAAGVHPLDVADARAQAKRDGVPTEFTPDGRVVFRNRRHRKQYLKTVGLVDKQGGYGDP